MPKARSPNRDKALEIYLKNSGNISNRKIAEILNISEKTVIGWKFKDSWEEKINGVLQSKERSTPKKTEGGQPKNQNAKGHGAPPRNQNRTIHGGYCQVFADVMSPQEITIAADLECSPLHLIKQELGLLTIRERRIMKYIWDLQCSSAVVTLDSVVKRKLEIQGNIAKGTEQKQTETTTKTISSGEAIRIYESELTKVQKAKGSYIKLLYDMEGDENEDGHQEIMNFIETLNQSAESIAF